MRESERAGKKGRAIDVDPAQVEEATPCSLCGEPLIEGATGDREPRGSYHRGCIRGARWARVQGKLMELVISAVDRQQRRGR